jgi:hypothetical protein
VYTHVRKKFVPLKVCFPSFIFNNHVLFKFYDERLKLFTSLSKISFKNTFFIRIDLCWGLNSMNIIYNKCYLGSAQRAWESCRRTLQIAPALQDVPVSNLICCARDEFVFQICTSSSFRCCTQWPENHITWHTPPYVNFYSSRILST